MIGRNIGPRVLINSTVLIVGAVIAHAIACGSFTPLLPFFLSGIAITLSLALVCTLEVEGPWLGLLALTSQIATHFMLGTTPPVLSASTMSDLMASGSMNMGSTMNPISMIATHSLAGAFSYLFIVKNDSIWDFATRIFSFIFTPLFKSAPFNSTTSDLFSWLELHLFVTRLQSYLSEATSRLSAPPLALA